MEERTNERNQTAFKTILKNHKKRIEESFQENISSKYEERKKYLESLRQLSLSELTSKKKKKNLSSLLMTPEYLLNFDEVDEEYFFLKKPEGKRFILIIFEKNKKNYVELRKKNGQILTKFEFLQEEDSIFFYGLNLFDCILNGTKLSILDVLIWHSENYIDHPSNFRLNFLFASFNHRNFQLIKFTDKQPAKEEQLQEEDIEIGDEIFDLEVLNWLVFDLNSFQSVYESIDGEDRGDGFLFIHENSKYTSGNEFTPYYKIFKDEKSSNYVYDYLIDKRLKKQEICLQLVEGELFTFCQKFIQNFKGKNSLIKCTIDGIDDEGNFLNLKFVKFSNRDSPDSYQRILFQSKNFL